MASVSIDAKALKEFAKKVRKEAPLLATRTRVGMKAAGDLVAADSRSRSGFSKRIPGATKTSFAGGKVSIYVDPGKAPNAAPIENGGKGNVRHPIPHTDKWTDKNSPPAFLHPALNAHEADAVVAMEKVVSSTLRSIATGDY